MKKIITITGCLGFLGSNLTREILKLGWYVIGIDSITYVSNTDCIKEFEKYPNFNFIHSDINDLKFLYETDYIIHTAACTHVANSIIDSNEFLKSNINGTQNILELLRNYRAENQKIPILISLSTDEVYGDIEVGAHKETDILKPSNPYSATKAAADMLVMGYGRTYNLPYIIIRPTNMFGKGQYVEKLIPKTIKYLTLDRKIPLHNNGTPIRNWLHVLDCIEAILLLIKEGNVNEIYNICGGFEQTNYTTVSKILKEYTNWKSTDLWDFENSYLDLSYNRPGQDVRYALDDSKLRALGWEPKIKFDTELKYIVNYYKEKFIW